jgi:hypothetical protein
MPGSLYQYRPPVNYQPENPYADVSEQVLRAIETQSRSRGQAPDPQLSSEIDTRDNYRLAALGLGMADQGLSASELALRGARGALRSRAPGVAYKAGNWASKLGRASNVAGIVTNVGGGVLDVASGSPGYGDEPFPWYTPAVDLADSSAVFTGPFYPAVQTIAGGYGSHLLNSRGAKMLEPALVGRPSEQFMLGRQSMPWGRNTVSSLLTGTLQDRMNATAMAWEDSYLAMKKQGATPQQLQASRTAMGEAWADYNRAQDDQTWIGKSSTSLQDIFGDKSAFPQMLEEGRQARHISAWHKAHPGSKALFAPPPPPVPELPPKYVEALETPWWSFKKPGEILFGKKKKKKK